MISDFPLQCSWCWPEPGWMDEMPDACMNPPSNQPTMKLHPCLLSLPASAMLVLASCAEPSMSGGPRTYAKLPRNHSGSTYYHQGRYYTGGQYQTGAFTYQGRRYTSRYYHNGRYYYGGVHKNFPLENHDFQHGDFPAGNYPDGNYQGTSWNQP